MLPTIPDGIRLIHKEEQHQHARWGFYHDLLEHGSDKLMGAAAIVLEGWDNENDPSTVPWAVALYKKYRHNPIKRAMIAGALCAAAINVRTFEMGQATRASLEQ